nr:hypothetical protein [Tanacetum cinerariifolium]
MGYEHLNITPETETDEVIESNAENLLPIPSECEVTVEDKRKFYDDDFEDIEYIEASLSDPEIVSIEEENGVEEENVVQQEEEEIDLEDISQIQDIVLHEKLLSITRLISNIESLNDNSTPDRVRDEKCNTTHADNSLPEYDSFCFEIEPDQERLINLVKNDIPDNFSNDPLLEEADLFLSDNSIPPGIENVADDPEGYIRFLEELLIDDSILSHESFDFNFEENSLISRPPPEPPDAETDAGEEIPIVMNEKDEDVDYSSFIFVIYPEMFSLLLSAESEDTIFDPESNAENLLPIPSKCEVTLEDKKECDLLISENSPICDNSDTFFDSKIDDISVYDDDFEDIEYVEASLSNPEIASVEEIVSVEEENVVQQEEEEEVNFEDISQIQDVVLREKLLSIIRLISNIESLNDNSTPDRVFNSF